MLAPTFAWNHTRPADRRRDHGESRPGGRAAEGTQDLQRDQERFGAALAAETPRLRRLVHRLLGLGAAAGDVEDVVQDALLAAFRSRRSFRGDATLQTWLTRIALRKAHDHVRQERRRKRLFSWFAREPHAPDGGVGVGGRDDGGGPADAVQAGLERLEHKDREVLVLRYLEQRGHETDRQIQQLEMQTENIRLILTEVDGEIRRLQPVRYEVLGRR
ncbi:MAG: RNA polymerase sigma factor [Planctomycetota bacterium]